MSVDDIKSAMFTYDKKIHNTHVVLAEKYLQFVGSKFRPSEQLSLEAGDLVVHWTREPEDVESQLVFNSFTFNEKVTWRLQMK